MGAMRRGAWSVGVDGRKVSPRGEWSSLKPPRCSSLLVAPLDLELDKSD